MVVRHNRQRAAGTLALEQPLNALNLRRSPELENHYTFVFDHGAAAEGYGGKSRLITAPFAASEIVHLRRRRYPQQKECRHLPTLGEALPRWRA
jgi:hypothetical protein